LQDAKNICSHVEVRVTVPRPCARSATILGMGVTVLIVDDHPSFRASARAMLESEGFEVVGEAADGASALEAAVETTNGERCSRAQHDNARCVGEDDRVHTA
jgi:hypothetical protein